MAKPVTSLLLAVALMTYAAPASAQTAQPPQSADPIRYTLSFPAPHTHYVEVAASVPTEGRPAIEMMMPVWTPGSYLIREFARHVEGFGAKNDQGASLAWEKTDKNRWRLETGGAARVNVSYRVYGREMAVRTNWIEASFALINGAPTFMTLVDGHNRPHEVAIQLPSAWKRSITGLAEAPGVAHQYRAPDFDTLVDSPMLFGNPAIYEFTIDGKKHFLANEGEAGVFDGAKAAKDLEAIVQEHRQLWGHLPYDKYVFLNVITEAGGGLEHKNSTVLMTSRWTTRTRKAYIAWLELASHEFFHTWNVKRLRPVELGPFDYENEAVTRSLWIAEGFTDYYGELLVHRAGVSTRDEYLEALSNQIETLQTTPGRLVQSASLASQDAWIKYYRPDENSANTSISYYIKGAVLAFVLDGKIRRATGGKKSLDDVMRAAYEKYAGERGYTQEQFKAVVDQVSRLKLDAFWASAVEGTAEMDYSEALDTLGLRFKRDPRGEAPGKAWLGISTRNDAGRLVVTQVNRGTPAHEAGINVDDEILAIDDFRVRADRLDNRLDQYKAGDKVTLFVARRELLQRIPITLGSEPPKQWRLEVNPDAKEEQKKRQSEWLGT